MDSIILRPVLKSTAYTLLIILLSIQLSGCTSSYIASDARKGPYPFEDDGSYAEVTFRGKRLVEDEYYVDSKALEPEFNSVETAMVENSQFIQHNPTFKETLDFLSVDKTDLQVYQENIYLCSHFASSLNNSAETQGIRCAMVIIRFQHQNHLIVGFETTDQGMVYFEPQTDEQVWPVIDKKFYQCIEARPGFYYEKPDYDDTITDIIVSW